MPNYQVIRTTLEGATAFYGINSFGDFEGYTFGGTSPGLPGGKPKVRLVKGNESVVVNGEDFVTLLDVYVTAKRTPPLDKLVSECEEAVSGFRQNGSNGS